jgi:hypothetical protein
MRFLDTEGETLQNVLGVGNTYGFHIEDIPQFSWAMDFPRLRPGPSAFPCLGEDGAYAVCLGKECTASYCWTGRLVRSAPHAKRRLPKLDRKGARCHTCARVTADHNVGDAGRELLTCGAGHFSCPITPSCLARRRIPESAPLACSEYVEASSLHPAVHEWRRRHGVSSARSHRRKRQRQAAAHAPRRRSV